MECCYKVYVYIEYQIKWTGIVKRKYWWPKMNAFIEDFINPCECIRSKSSRHKPYGLLQLLPIPCRPWDCISTDFITDLPPSQGYNSISVWICRLSKMAHFIPCSNKETVDSLAKIFRDVIFRLHVLSSSIVSDHGTQFISSF